MLRPEGLRGDALATFELWTRVGLSERAALTEVARAHPQAVEPFDAMVRMFEALGLSEGAARTAAAGRDRSEGMARRSVNEAVRSASAPAPSLEVRAAIIREALDRCSDEDCAAIVEATRTRRVKGKKPAAPAGPVPITETTTGG
jgi:hypothetical protein